MKFPKKLAAAAVGAALVGSVQASTVGTSTITPGSGVAAVYGGGFTIAAEAAQTAAYNVTMDGAATPLGGTPAAQDIFYVPSFGLNSGDIITITFNGALYMGADVKLIAEEAVGGQINLAAAQDVDANGGTTDVVEVASNFGSVDATNGVSSVQVRINNGLTLPTGITLLLQTGTCTNAGGVCTANNTNPPFRIPAGTASGTTVTASTTGVTSGGTAIPAAANTNDGGIMDLLTQFTLTTTGATSVADVGAATPRTNFVEEGAAGTSQTTATDDTDLTVSSGTYTFGNDSTAVIEDEITIDAGDILTMSLVSSTNIDAISTVAGALDIEADGTAGNLAANGTDVDFTLTAGSTTTYTAPLLGVTNLRASGGAQTDNVSIGVDGTSIIADRTWALSGTLVMDADVAFTSGASYALTGGTSHTWTTNGTILEATYVNTNGDFNNRFVLSNSGSTDAAFSITCLVETGNTCTPGADGTVPANGTVVLGTSDVITMGGTGNQNRGTVIITVEAPSTTIQGHTQVVKPGTGIESSHPMIRPGTN